MATIQIEKISREEAYDNCDYCARRQMHIHWYILREDKLNANTVPCFDLMDKEVSEIISKENFEGFIKVIEPPLDEQPCPHCKSMDLSTTSNGEEQYNVLCNGCGAEGPTGVNEKDAENMWNSRG